MIHDLSHLPFHVECETFTDDMEIMSAVQKHEGTTRAHLKMTMNFFSRASMHCLRQWPHGSPPYWIRPWVWRSLTHTLTVTWTTSVPWCHYSRYMRSGAHNDEVIATLYHSLVNSSQALLHVNKTWDRRPGYRAIVWLGACILRKGE